MRTRRRSKSGVVRLTPRQRQILMLLAEGKRPREIARELVISEETVKTHIKDICSRLGVHGTLEALAAARRLGFL